MEAPSGLLDFFFQAEDGTRDTSVTGVQTCALPILFWATLSFQPRCPRAVAERSQLKRQGRPEHAEAGEADRAEEGVSAQERLGPQHARHRDDDRDRKSVV